MLLNRRNTTIISGAIIIIITILTFILTIKDWARINWLGLFFVLLAEITLIGGLLLIDIIAKSSFGLMLRGAAYGVLGGYSVFSIIISVIFMSLLQSHIRFYVLIQLFAIAFTVILLLILIGTSKSIYANNQKVLQSLSKIQNISNQVKLLHKNIANKVYSSPLEKLYEAILYCDSSTTVSTDDDVIDKIKELELALASENEDKDSKVIEIVDCILLLMNKRAAEIKEVKAGAI